MRTQPRAVGLAADLLLVVALSGAMVVELSLDDATDTPVAPWSVALVVAASLPVLLRRERPVLAVVLAMAALYVVLAATGIYQTVPFPSMVCGYALALATDRRRTVIAGLVLVPFVVAAVFLFGHTVIPVTEYPKNLAFVAAPLILGSAVRERRAHLQSLVDRAEAAERTREEEARRRVGEERLRIARDVHDVVAHAMVAINVQAGVGAHLLDRDPERARRMLQDIKRVSGEALADLRSTLEVIRTPEEGDSLAPTQPTQSLRDLRDLGRVMRSAGVDLDLTVDPATDDLPSTVTVTGYRIVQEALTNVVRHAPGTRVRASVALVGDRLVIDVRNDVGEVDGQPVAPRGTGNGLRGMRERAEAIGGSLTAGPDADEGGWRVTASLPARPLGVPSAPVEVR